MSILYIESKHSYIESKLYKREQTETRTSIAIPSHTMVYRG